MLTFYSITCNQRLWQSLSAGLATEATVHQFLFMT